MNPSVSVSPTAEKMVRKSGARDAFLFLVVWVLPFLVEFIPWDRPVPLSAHLVPLYWVMFAGVFLFGPTRGALLGLSAPLLQAGLQGVPMPGTLPFVAFELVVFGIVTHLLTQRVPGFWWIAPFGLVAAVGVSSAFQFLAPGGAAVSEPFTYTLQRLQIALPGLFALGVLNLAFHKLHPPAEDWDEK